MAYHSEITDQLHTSSNLWVVNEMLLNTSVKVKWIWLTTRLPRTISYEQEVLKYQKLKVSGLCVCNTQKYIVFFKTILSHTRGRAFIFWFGHL